MTIHPGNFSNSSDDLSYNVYDLFGRPFKIADWASPDRPWYAIGVRSASEDEAFVRDRLPDLLRDLLTSERSPDRSVVAASGRCRSVRSGPHRTLCPVALAWVARSCTGILATIRSVKSISRSIGMQSVCFSEVPRALKRRHGFIRRVITNSGDIAVKNATSLLGAVTVRRRREPWTSAETDPRVVGLVTSAERRRGRNGRWECRPDSSAVGMARWIGAGKLAFWKSDSTLPLALMETRAPGLCSTEAADV